MPYQKNSAELQRRSAEGPDDGSEVPAAPSGQPDPGSHGATRQFATGRSRRYTVSEKADLLKQIDVQLSGGSTLRAATKIAGITEQSYYQWKRSAKAQGVLDNQSSNPSDSLSDLIDLEAENQRLRALLADKLRHENADLKKRLGIV